MFIVLTRAILSDLLVHWIPLGDVGKLDSAVCGRVEREQFLALIKADPFGRRTTVGRYSCKASFIAWVLKRNVNLQLCELVVDDVLIGSWELQKSVLPLIGPNLKKVAISKVCVSSSELVDKFVLELSLHCTGLLECEFTSFSDGPMTALLARNPHMRSVKLNSTMKNQVSDMLHAIGMLCPQIECIAISCAVSPRSFKRFMESAPATLTGLCLPLNDFTLTELVALLQQCRDLSVLRIGAYSPENPTFFAQFVHPHMRLFRANQTYNSSGYSTLSKLMPNLTTMIVIQPAGNPQPNAIAVDPASIVVLLLQNFRYLRQLFVGDTAGEHALSELPPVSVPVPAPVTHTVSTTSKPTTTQSTRRKPTPPVRPVLPALPEAGIFLEELYCAQVTEVVSAIALPALRSVGCERLPSSALPAAVKKLTVTGWHSCHDARMKHLRNLEEIDLHIGEGVTNTGILHLAHQNPHLRVLRVKQRTYYGGAISAVGLWNVLQNCPFLHTVEYTVERTQTNSPKLTDYLLQQMCRKSFPNIKHLEYSV